MRTVVFVLRGCPAGWLGAYGNEWVVTPNLDRLAAESVVFDRHVSDCPDPAAASAAWLGGPSAVGFRRASLDKSSGPRLVDALRAANVRTVMVRANQPDSDGPAWFYAGWDEVFDARPLEEDELPLDALIRSLPSVLDRLANHPEFLLWVEIDRLLPPWDVPQGVFGAYRDEDYEDLDDEEVDDASEDDEDSEEAEEPDAELAELRPPAEVIPPWSDPPTGPFDDTDPDAREWLHTSFGAVVTALDAELGAVFDQLRSRGLDRTAAWVITSDYGYPLGEHGQIGRHRPWLHQELVHLPLMLRLPGAAEACRRVPGFTQPPDLFPTLLDLCGVAPVEGVGLLPMARGEGESARPHAVTVLEVNGAAEAAIRTDDSALLLPLKVPDGETREPLLYEKPDDRWEVNDIRARNIERADELEAELRKSMT